MINDKSEDVIKGAAIVGMTEFIRLYKKFSTKAFGPNTDENNREAGVINHIRLELKEITKAETPEDKMAEWVDIILLGIDGAWRTGCTPAQIAKAVWAKFQKNLTRDWPDWRNSDPTKALEHRRGKND